LHFHPKGLDLIRLVGWRVVRQVSFQAKVEQTLPNRLQVPNVQRLDVIVQSDKPVVYVSALRANGIPARTLVGRWARSAEGTGQLDGQAWYQTHVKTEFFVSHPNVEFSGRGPGATSCRETDCMAPGPLQRRVRPEIYNVPFNAFYQEPQRLRLGFLFCFTAWRRESRSPSGR
jgi:hypothetical protein